VNQIEHARDLRQTRGSRGGPPLGARLFSKLDIDRRKSYEVMVHNPSRRDLILAHHTELDYEDAHELAAIYAALGYNPDLRRMNLLVRVLATELWADSTGCSTVRSRKKGPAKDAAFPARDQLSPASGSTGPHGPALGGEQGKIHDLFPDGVPGGARMEDSHAPGLE
jgi:hypothetical protein